MSYPYDEPAEDRLSAVRDEFKPKPKKSHKKRVEHLKQAATQYTPVEHFPGRIHEPEPMSLGDVFEADLGPQGGQDAELALRLIDSGPDLKLSLRQWGAVQALVEAAIRAGRAGM